MGIDVTKDAERVPLEKRRAIARAEGGKLFDVNAALGRKRTIATRVVDPTVVMDRAVTRASKEADKAEAALARELARAEKARKRAAALAEKRRAAVVPTKKRKGAAPKYPSQTLRTMSGIRCVAPFEWLAPAARQVADANKRDLAWVIREAVRAEAAELASVEQVKRGVTLAADIIAPTRVPADEAGLLTAIDRTAKRLSKSTGRNVSGAEVIRASLAKWLRGQGFGPKEAR
jgi:hypothetical protein